MPRKSTKNKIQKEEPSDKVAELTKRLGEMTQLEIVSVFGNRDTATIRFGAIKAMKMKKHEEQSMVDLVLSLDDLQVMYLNLRSEGVFSDAICSALAISRLDPVVWAEESDVFAQCIEGIKIVEANDAEEMLWMLAKHSPMASSERSLGLQGRKPEYNSRKDIDSGGQRVVFYLHGREFNTSNSLMRGDDEESSDD